MEGKEPYQLVKRLHHELKNAESDVDDSEIDQTMEPKVPSDNEEPSP